MITSPPVWKREGFPRRMFLVFFPFLIFSIVIVLVVVFMGRNETSSLLSLQATYATIQNAPVEDIQGLRATLDAEISAINTLRSQRTAAIRNLNFMSSFLLRMDPENRIKSFDFSTRAVSVEAPTNADIASFVSRISSYREILNPSTTGGSSNANKNINSYPSISFTMGNLTSISPHKGHK